MNNGGYIEIRQRAAAPAYEVVYREILKSILSGKYKAGKRLTEGELSRQLKVSRTTVREALKRLVDEKYLMYSPNIGVKVNDIPETELYDLWILRARIEGYFAELAAERLSNSSIKKLSDVVEQMSICGNDWQKASEYLTEFHSIIENSSNNYHIRLLSSWIDYINQSMRLLMRHNHLHDKSPFHEHYIIYKAIAERDKVTARKAAESHVIKMWYSFKREYIYNNISEA